ncbi:hypothetical protein DEO72_LG5g225 [Vigna unguiculata]|uniref:Ulp1 protease family n=1 Tax=Vigna unguiculata TaxID=3917 RepID=A0A4D6LW99_VIGUN|nr:hypothetical protein DEO72_LG5g225 [Vigna unguiculata]
MSWIRTIIRAAVKDEWIECNKQEDSWECGYYVMSWIRTIIRAAVKDEWIERFKNPSPLPDDIIHTLRQEWAAYLLERWS